MAQPFEPEDLFLEHRITDLHAAPSRPLAACAVKSVDRDQDSYHSSLWLFPLDGQPSFELTPGLSYDDQPRWSPDGRTLAFVSDRSDGMPQIHLIAVDGGEARRLSRLDEGATSLAWSPDGKRLLATAQVKVDPDARGAPRDGPPPERDENAPQLVWRLPYKSDGSGYTLERQTHLFTVDAGSGESTQLTHGAFDVRSAAWSPDGKRIVHTRTRDEPRYAHRTDVWVVDDDGRHARQLSREQGTVMSPTWSPDGRWIAFAGALDDGDAQARLWLVEVDSGDVRPLGDEGIEVAPGDLQWSRDSQRVAFVLARRGLLGVATVSLEGELRRLVTGEFHVEHLAANDDWLVYTSESPALPPQVRALPWSGDGDATQHSRFCAWWDDRVLPRVEWRRFEVPDGDGGTESIDGWLLRPADDRGTTPLLVDVHGGPASYASVDQSITLYWQVLCARGWSVLALNAVGSASYGRDFAARLRGHWGELDLPQHLAAVKALQDEGRVDDRLAIAGSSYGGYLSAWAIGNCTTFRAAVVRSPVANLESHYGTSDSGYYADPYSMCGEPTIDREASMRLSPMKYVAEARTPTLFLQGADDERCPRGQAEELFVTLMRGGDTPAELVLYPGGSHHVYGKGKPSHRLDALQRTVDWLQRWVEVPLPPAKKKDER